MHWSVRGRLNGSAGSAGALVEIAQCLVVTGASVHCVNEGHSEQQLDLFILFPYKPSRKAGTQAAAHQGPANAICSHATLKRLASSPVMNDFSVQVLVLLAPNSTPFLLGWFEINRSKDRHYTQLELSIKCYLLQKIYISTKCNDSLFIFTVWCVKWLL